MASLQPPYSMLARGVEAELLPDSQPTASKPCSQDASRSGEGLGAGRSGCSPSGDGMLTAGKGVGHLFLNDLLPTGAKLQRPDDQKPGVRVTPAATAVVAVWIASSASSAASASTARSTTCGPAGPAFPATGADAGSRTARRRGPAPRGWHGGGRRSCPVAGRQRGSAAGA